MRSPGKALTVTQVVEQRKRTPYAPAQALGLILHEEFTKRQYERLRQALLDHSCSRIIEMQSDVLDQILDISTGDFTVYVRIDVSTGQSNFKQRYDASSNLG